MLAPTFSERNAELVWDESILQAEQMLKSWLDCKSTEAPCIPNVRADTMMLPFNVINKAGFGVDLPWVSQSDPMSQTATTSSVDTADSGHYMSYREALHLLIRHLFHIIVLPTWLLRFAPFAYAKLLRTVHGEAIAYLKELIKRKEDQLTRSTKEAGPTSGSDIMSALVSAKLERQNRITRESHTEGPEDEEALTEKAILANVFLMLIAGHETTATVLLLTLVELAINVEWQREVQKDLDQILGRRQKGCWNFRIDVAMLSNGTVGATINEILRLYPPINVIPKGTR
ncbi:hypothetical protein LTS18_005085, partial [Coniosporium uncinatum]